MGAISPKRRYPKGPSASMDFLYPTRFLLLCTFHVLYYQRVGENIHQAAFSCVYPVIWDDFPVMAVLHSWRGPAWHQDQISQEASAI